MADHVTADAFRHFVERHRAQCLWFLRPDYWPETVADRLAVLNWIEQYGDRRAFQEAARFRRWLSLPSNDRSAGA